MLTKGFEKTAGTISHFAKHRKDYFMGAAAAGSLATAVGSNRAANAAARSKKETK